MQCGIVVPIGIERESEIAVGLSVCWIDAESGPRFCKGIVGVVRPVKKIGKLVVRLRETRCELRGFGKFIERFVEPLLPAQNGSKNKL
jgi:hypothetical protein